MLAKQNIMFSCRLGRSPVSFVLRRITWNWGLRGFTAYPASVVRFTSDRLVVYRNQNERTPPAHTVWTSSQIGGGRI
jgi:hypothetical protein